ncbi:MAG: RMD1 family protein [Cyclobacteriaceae bacterium]|nr:RMD1 family protein [Cyclobacteriaceae bacterium]
METIVKLSAIRVANQIDLKGIKSMVQAKPIGDSSSELFYHCGEGKYLYYFNYGVVVFCDHNDEEIQSAIKSVAPHLKNAETWLRDDYLLQVIPGCELRFEFDHVSVDHTDDSVIRVTMLNLGQSVALDHYNGLSENLLTEIKGFTNDLQSTGRLNINRKNMMKFIGRALNTQNDIADNIYIFDAPEQVWENEYLDTLHQGLMKHFDLKVRFSEIEYTLRIIQSNLSVFREISNQRESNRLEWIIVILILIEVFDLFISKFL